PLTAPTPAASTTKPNRATVEAASSCLRPRRPNATAPLRLAVLPPLQAVTRPARPDEARHRSTRHHSPPPITTLAAQTTSAPPARCRPAPAPHATTGSRPWRRSLPSAAAHPPGWDHPSPQKARTRTATVRPCPKRPPRPPPQRRVPPGPVRPADRLAPCPLH